MFHEEKPKPERARYTMKSRDFISIGHLQPGECDDLEAMLNGCCWIRITEDGRLERRDRFLELPPPEPDPQLHLHFTDTPCLLHTLLSSRSTWHAGITISSLCGYHYSPDNYRKEAAKLESYGFDCLRGRRGQDGRHRELWYLSSLILARGELRECVEAVGPVSSDLNEQGEANVKAACKFLCEHVAFGSLDVTVQRAAMVVD